MPLVTDLEVKEIISTSLTDLTAFITAADLIVTEDLNDKGLSVARLKEIERWLAAHLVAINEDRARKSGEGIGRSNVQFGGQYGLGLNHTRYGQQAIILDTSGTLAAKITGKKAIFDPIEYLDEE